MPEFSGRGLQITPRCVKCGKLSTADITLFEMQNHLYICNLCRQQDEQRGRTIAWIKPMPPFKTTMPPPSSSGTVKRTRSGKLPPDSIFALLEMPLNAPLGDLRKAFKQKISALMRDPDTRAHANRLREEWHAKLLDEERFERYRANLLTSVGHEENVLLVGGRSVLTAQEFVDACEASRRGWADGERYLRTGQLRQWLLFHLKDRQLSRMASHYQKLDTASNFRALNTLLYCMVPQRPFRFYYDEEWESTDQISSATKLSELAQLCDADWKLAEKHLYEGSMLEWVETAYGVEGIRAYSQQCVFTYANVESLRGVGLELFLERILPDLPRPKLEVTFDGVPDACLVGPWDREIEHKEIVVDIVNTTRGFVNLHMALLPSQKSEAAEWLTLSHTSQSGFHCKLGERVHWICTLVPHDLSDLARGGKYQRTLVLTQTAEPDNPLVRECQVQLQIMHIFQGLEGKLWLWGMRGNLPGLFWNSLLALLLAFFLVQFALGPWLTQYSSLGIQFYLITFALSSLVGFLIGLDKGHKKYLPQQSAKNFRALTCWLIMFGVIFQLGRDLVLQSSGPQQTLSALTYGLRDLLVGLLLLIILFSLSFIRREAEMFLRSYYKSLTRPAGGIY